MSDTSTELITIAEAADLTGANPEVIRRAAEYGEFPARKIRRVWVTTKAAVLEWDSTRQKKMRSA